MSKALRWSEKWFRRGLWLLAFVFAWFLMGLGSTIVGDLPQVEQQRTLDDFLDSQRAPALKAGIQQADRSERDLQAELEQLQLQQQAAQASHRAARDSFQQWLATRTATQRPDQDDELVQRTRALDNLRQAERAALAAVEARQQSLLDVRQGRDRAQAELRELTEDARQRFDSARRAQELRVFAYRLALTLPLLALAGWLFVRKRHTNAWPFVWGFIIFAGFAFFVELVPYLPSYGGYVHYIVGIVITVLGGRHAIAALQRYQERQRQAETLPDTERRQALDYDLALTRLAKGVCPGCERTVDLKDPANDFCPHCGICLHNRCSACRTRKNAFARYCHGCGEPAAVNPGPASGAVDVPAPAA